MNHFPAYILHCYDEEVIRLISEKYGFPPLEALRMFLKSKTYQMLVNPELEMWDFSPLVIFDLWENEKITGNPRTSVYLRAE